MAYGLLYDYLMGNTIEAFTYFGAHHMVIDNEEGFMFRLYAPNADDVSVIGDFNNWDVTQSKMKKIDDSGVWELFIPHVYNYQNYKYHFKNAKGRYVDKCDPFAFFSELRPATCSRLFNIDGFIWHDDDWLKNRTRNHNSPMSIYEMHLGSWKGLVDGRNPSYEEVADYVIEYVKKLGYTHIEIMPITQYPFDGSWGYQATGFYSVDSRYGNPFQLMSLIDRLHQAGIGVILDFAPVHFANDKFALAEFDGTKLYEYSNEYRVSPWGSLQFDLGKDPVRSFLMSAMNYFISYFHADGIRVDAVSNIIFYNGNKTIGTNDGGVEFCKRLNGKIHFHHPTVMMIAEDSSDFSGVTRDTTYGGLGFDYKWDLGWMNDTLKYYALDPIYKKYDHNKLTFSMAYFYSENFLLPLSHDEVVHGKGTIINKMYGDYETKFSLLRNLYTYQWSHPGKKLNFMGNELASFDEWNESKSLPWELQKFPKHDSISRMIRDLNLIYRGHPAMYLEEYNPERYRWLLVNDGNNSVFAFERKCQDETLVFIFNMTPNYFENFEIPVYEEGEYEEIFNSDKDVYGGTNQYNGLNLPTYPYGNENKPYHIVVKLASYGAMILKLKKKLSANQELDRNIPLKEKSSQVMEAKK